MVKLLGASAPETSAVQRHSPSEIDAAKQLLQRHGYVVVERDRVKVVEADVIVGELDLKYASNPWQLIEYVRRCLLDKLFDGIADMGGCLKETESNVTHPHRGRRLVSEVTLIVPEQAKS
ncbi:hypothetical protein [Bradyrhizobium sp. Tv2a-2]|uniref:hypothetical protein n=1 Tax=Bradyrhizobium sp. Tv2a-2 TaxID=113395 RepID=UPI0004064016|nr:hypothetical protein [Bradyrhizobium sp. Tv2a-2]